MATTASIARSAHAFRMRGLYPNRLRFVHRLLCRLMCGYVSGRGGASITLLLTNAAARDNASVGRPNSVVDRRCRKKLKICDGYRLVIRPRIVVRPHLWAPAIPE